MNEFHNRGQPVNHSPIHDLPTSFLLLEETQERDRHREKSKQYMLAPPK